MSSAAGANQRLERLMSYLSQDPANPALLGDACLTAFDSGRLDVAEDILDRYVAVDSLPPNLLNLKGLIAMRQDRFDDAITIFEALLAKSPDEPTLRFNLAWSKSMVGKNEEAAELIDDLTQSSVPGAAALKIRALHVMGDLDAALSCSDRLTESNMRDESLMGALSIVAIDARLTDRAREWGQRAQGTPEGLSALGVLSLQEQQLEKAIEYFNRGLILRADSARNLLGKGLALLVKGDVAVAAEHIDRSAQLFGTHLGTWIASGWAHFACGDNLGARRIFEHALALDDTFSESHGALAVLDIMDGDVANARLRADVALRLDRRSLAGALAKSLLLDHDGDSEAAQRVRELALNTPLESGQTLAQSLAMMAPVWSQRRKP